MSDPHLRMSDAERDRAAAELGEHYAQGRLTADEHADRLDRILAARTHGELGPIFVDLPGTPTPVWPRGSTSPAAAPRRRRFRGLPVPLVVLIAVLVAVTVVAHLPLILLGLGVWFLLSRQGSCSSRAPSCGSSRALRHH